MRGLLCLPLLALTAGCWQPRYFIPRENLNGTGPDGSPSAVYQIRHDEATVTLGEIRVWSSGAKAYFTDNDVEVVDLHIGFEIENTGKEPLELEVGSLGLEEVFVDGYLKDSLIPLKVKGASTAAPGLTTRVDLVFRPPTTFPRDVDSFSVRFVVRDSQGNRVGQLTPFVPDRRDTGRGSALGVGYGYGRGGFYGGFYGGYYGGYGLWGRYGRLRCR